MKQKILISGGASGIGLATAQHLANQGAQLVLIDLNDKVHEALATLEGEGHTAFALDVTNAEQVIAAVDEASLAGPITGVAISAGIVSQDTLLDITNESFMRVLSVNVLGVQNIIAPIARKMIDTKTNGSIVVLSSVAAFNGGGLMGRGAYATSKAAVLGLVKSYARELAPAGIRINTVAPGATETPMTENLSDDARKKILAQTMIGRFLEADEIVGAISFLLSDASTAFTGQTLHANGGTYLA
jgi:3-oxoacyl-[acyl-carrier protein] reductase